MDYVIESDVPVCDRRGAAAKYPLGEMKVGDSFAFAAEAVTKIRAAATAWQRTHPGQKFTVSRRERRCWRIA